MLRRTPDAFPEGTAVSGAVLEVPPSSSNLPITTQASTGGMRGLLVSVLSSDGVLTLEDVPFESGSTLEMAYDAAECPGQYLVTAVSTRSHTWRS